jgi:nucleoside-triphosphatase THEP1
MTKNLLLTGTSGSGKTTLIRRLSEIFKEFNPAGFYTGEIGRTVCRPVPLLRLSSATAGSSPT